MFLSVMYYEFPLFTADGKFDLQNGYDESTKTLSWSYKSKNKTEHDKIISDFTAAANSFLNQVKAFDPEQLRAQAVYKKHELQLERGDEIYVYTDGVTEAADAENKLYGEERLQAVLSAAHGTPETLCKTVRADVEKFTKGAEQSDDITMLCVKLNPDKREAQLTVTPDKDSVGTVVDFLTEALEKWEISMKLAGKAQIAVDEIYSNIVYYSGAKSATVTVADNGEKLTVCFADDGKPYDPTTAKEPDITLSAEEREIGGLGIFMVKKMAAEIRYRNENGKNILQVGFAKE